MYAQDVTEYCLTMAYREVSAVEIFRSFCIFYDQFFADDYDPTRGCTSSQDLT